MGTKEGRIGGGVVRMAATVAVSVTVGGGGVVVGKAVWVSAMLVFAMTTASVCISGMFGCAGLHPIRNARKTIQKYRRGANFVIMGILI